MTVSRSVATRLLHLLLLLAVIHQLVNSQFIHRPHPGEPPSLLWAMHQYVGVTSLAVVSAFWLWALLRKGETPLAALLPWFSGRRLRALATDAGKYARDAMDGRLADDRDSALAEAVHGLGLLVVSLMTVTGTVWLLSASGTTFGRTALNIHKLFANLMWAYLVAHAGLALLHHVLGSDILSRMFLPRRVAVK